ncbi:MAG: response regulator [Candidatus Omnitrophica bacterium]|nr:response regulator [Candidatus Omnitrophota bacterium]
MIESERKTISILIADDDDDDVMLVTKALKEYRFLNDLQRVRDGEELLDYLFHRGNYTDADKFPLPNLILLDLNMPRKDGREALKEIKDHHELRKIPVIILTTSKTDEDIVRSYDLGVNSFVTKPVEFKDFMEVIKNIGTYWLEIVQLP